MSAASEPEEQPPIVPADPTPVGGRGGESPYRNLWVPLVVVPFLVVGVIVLVFLFFGAIRGQDASIAENLETVVEGGANERKQAAVSLAVQVQENRRALAEGREPEWEAGPHLLDDIRRAWERTARDDSPHIRLTLAQLAALYGDPQAPEMLASFLALPDSDDPQGELRVPAMLALSWTGDPAAARLVIPFLQHEDPFLRQSAAGILQAIPGAETRAALRGLLDDPVLELRGQAAISLARLGDPAGAEVLRELAGREAYEAVRASDPRKFASDKLVHQSRLEAVNALATLGRPEDRPLLERLAEEDGDPAVREAAMRALQGAPGGAG